MTLLYLAFAGLVVTAAGAYLYYHYSSVFLAVIVRPRDIFEYVLHRGRDRLLRYLDLHFRHSSSHPVCEVHYYDGFNKHVVRFPKKRGPTPFVRVCDENETDVTANIMRYCGPSRNFHGIPTSPQLLGYNKLSFTMKSGNVLVFTEHEKIDFT